MSSTAYTIEDIERAVCSFFAIETRELRSRSQARRIAYPRFMAWDLARKLTPLSSPQLGQRYGRDHSTILHGAAKSRQLRADNQRYQNQFTGVCDVLEHGPKTKELRRMAVEKMPIVFKFVPRPVAAAWV